MTDQNLISYEDFTKVHLRVVTILEAERVPKSDKLLRLTVTLGEEERQIIAGIGQTYEPSTLVGQQVAAVINLEPRSIMGLESHGMILAASTDQGPVILSPRNSEVLAGSIIR
ncbi:MAG: methionine--tRNA ligase subunit beta [Candidatus Vogelbacteria bacterium RIFOXYD1_FULL_46_19]|uniref:Methionine--tRNA ligase n=1 Tax=Candidatus Vogelbacteria bacterium RIFOXYD1_FULL_46_19 TaxID=1802439 RepID=A0A1G2QHS3_9BACT|nr:MAG: methionine--tRNA ligase subunit beta [Candidatus Vogelbacteria bacterium RIFOXYD1_FULL_46_19]